MTSLDLINCLNPIKQQTLLLTCALISNLPSNISIIIWTYIMLLKYFSVRYGSAWLPGLSATQFWAGRISRNVSFHLIRSILGGGVTPFAKIKKKKKCPCLHNNNTDLIKQMFLFDNAFVNKNLKASIQNEKRR